MPLVVLKGHKSGYMHLEMRTMLLGAVWHHLNMLQVEFIRQSLEDKKLAKAYRRHAAMGGFGLCCFALEDVAIQHGHHFVHSLWHLNACYAVASTNALMQRREAPE